MAYLVTQIFVCLLLAALLGGLVGWLLRGRRQTEAPEAPEALVAAYRRAEALERELAAYRSPAPPAATDAGA